jgi:threonine/homoserine efflux transporter RhtA
MDQEINLEELKKGNGIRKWITGLCFGAFGITAFVNLADPLNPVNLVFGFLAGLLFGALCKKFMKAVLGAGNGELKKEHGKKSVSIAVDRGMVFIVPFAVMALAASFLMGWTITGGFVSAGVMTTGAMSAVEIGKLKEKPGMKNTILASVTAWCFSMLWFFAIPFAGKIPSYLEGGITLLFSLKDQILQ